MLGGRADEEPSDATDCISLLLLDTRLVELIISRFNFGLSLFVSFFKRIPHRFEQVAK